MVDVILFFSIEIIVYCYKNIDNHYHYKCNKKLHDYFHVVLYLIFHLICIDIICITINLTIINTRFKNLYHFMCNRTSNFGLFPKITVNYVIQLPGFKILYSVFFDYIVFLTTVISILHYLK